MNLAAGLLCSGLSAIIQFATVRYYLGALGAESYGLLGILALIGMQAAAISAQSDARYRIEAANIAEKMSNNPA